MIRVADYMIERLVQQGVKSIFYVSGGQCFYLTDALRRSTDINAVAMHHEQAVSMAAVSNALITNNIGACIVTTGCAGTNTMTGLLHAWQDSIPCIFISGQQNYDQTVKHSGLPLRQVGIQEADTETIMKPITKFAVTVESADKIAYYIDKALFLAMDGRKGPVWLDVPMNIQNAMVDVEKLERYCPKTEKVVCRESDLDDIVKAICQSCRPIILAGHGIRTSGAGEQLKNFAHANGIPVVFSRFARDLLPYDDPYNMGIVSGAAGASRYGNFAIQNSDLVLCLGCRLAIETTGPERGAFAREAKIIVVDIDDIEHAKDGVKIDKFVHADVVQVLSALNSAKIVTRTEVKEWLKKCAHWKDIFEYNTPFSDSYIDLKIAMTEISLAMPDNSVVISDAGLTGASVSAATRINETQRIIVSFAQGEMGFALPGACGIAAEIDAPVISYSGDGSFMMNLQELQTVVRNQYNIKIIIINNDGYSGVRHGQKAHFRGKTIGTDPSNGIDFPDYQKIADAFGIAYGKIEKPEELQEKIPLIFENDMPYMCEIMCDPEQFDLHNALVRYKKNGKWVFAMRPIEDQSPFIERDVFFREMIVEPMESSSGEPV